MSERGWNGSRLLHDTETLAAALELVSGVPVEHIAWEPEVLLLRASDPWSIAGTL